MNFVLESFIIRIYRYQSGHPERLVGLIQSPSMEPPLGFTGVDELWQAIQTFHDTNKGREQEAAALQDVHE